MNLFQGLFNVFQDIVDIAIKVTSMFYNGTMKVVETKNERVKMDTIETIEQIKEQADQVTKALKGFIPSRHEEKNYNYDYEYTAQSLKAGINAILTDIRGLIRAHNKFLKLSTFRERSQISISLRRISSSLDSKEYSDAIENLETLKTLIRGYNVRGSSETKDVYEKRFAQINSELVDAEENLNKIKGIKETAEQQEQQLQSIKEQQEQRLRSIEDFFEQIAERENQLTDQKRFTDEYKEKLTSFEKEREEKLEAAEELIKQARAALEYRTAAGISAAFTERYNEEKKKWWMMLGWLVGALSFIAIAIGIGFWTVVWGNQDIGPGMAVFRITIMLTALPGAWFCASQYAKYRNIRKDYGYKAVLSKSMVGFMDSFSEDEDVKGNYLKTVLKEIHQDPLRKRHDDSGSVWQRTMNALRRDKEKSTGTPEA